MAKATVVRKREEEAWKGKREEGREDEERMIKGGGRGGQVGDRSGEKYINDTK